MHHFNLSNKKLLNPKSACGIDIPEQLEKKPYEYIKQGEYG